MNGRNNGGKEKKKKEKRKKKIVFRIDDRIACSPHTTHTHTHTIRNSALIFDRKASRFLMRFTI
jgi:hypothetical protein